MPVMDLIVNGKPVSTAGADDLCVLSVVVSAVGRIGSRAQDAKVRRRGMDIACNLGGMTSRSTEPRNIHLEWARVQLKVGDEVRLQIRGNQGRSSARTARRACNAWKET